MMSSKNLMSEEVWSPLPMFEDRYEISTFGNVRHIILRKNRKFKKYKGYLYVNINDGGRNRTIVVHRHVLMAFDRMPMPGEEACHNDGNSENNRLDNLRWDTHLGNEADKKTHGTSNLRTYPKELLERIAGLLRAGETQATIAKMCGISKSTVSKLKIKIHRECGGGEMIFRRRISSQDVLKIRELHLLGEAPSELAEKFELHVDHVRNVINRKRWKNI